MKIQKIQEAIKKYDMSLVTKDGQEMVRIGKPPRSEKIAGELRAAKPEIITELKRQKAERVAQWAAREAGYKAKEEEYAKTADLRRCLVCDENENYTRRYSIKALVFTTENEVFPDEGGILRAFQPEFRGLMNSVPLKHVTPEMKTIAAGDGVPYGMYGAAWEITSEQEAAIVAEHTLAEEEAARKAAEKKARKEAELAGKFAQAKETGTPVIIRTYMVPCSDPREECDADHVVEYAMPDGTTKREQHHTW